MNELEQFNAVLGKMEEAVFGAPRTPDDDQTLWAIVTDDNQLVYLDASTREQAEACIDDMWAETCAGDGIAHGDVNEKTYTLVSLVFGEDATRQKTESYTASYEGYHGDYKEHFDQSMFV